MTHSADRAFEFAMLGSQAAATNIFTTSGELHLALATVNAPEQIAIHATGDASISVASSILIGTCLMEGSATVSSGGYNAESPGGACDLDSGTDLVSLTAEQLALGPLGDHGGPTRTHALQAAAWQSMLSRLRAASIRGVGL